MSPLLKWGLVGAALWGGYKLLSGRASAQPAPPTSGDGTPTPGAYIGRKSFAFWVKLADSPLAASNTIIGMLLDVARESGITVRNRGIIHISSVTTHATDEGGIDVRGTIDFTGLGVRAGSTQYNSFIRAIADFPDIVLLPS